MAFGFKLLGDLRIEESNQPLSLPPFRTHSLLAALLLRPRRQQRQQLAGLLYPDRGEAWGRRRLSDLIYLLRKSIPGLPIVASNDLVFLPVESRWLDVEEFKQAEEEKNQDSWVKAINLYKGDLLGGYCDDWLLEERESLRLDYVRVAHRLADFLVLDRKFEQALLVLEHLVLEEPYDEKALRLIMQAYFSLGRRGAALAAYERFQSQAWIDLGVEPDKSTQNLAQAIHGTHAVRLVPAKVPDYMSMDPKNLTRQARMALEGGDRIALGEIIKVMQIRSEFRDDVEVKLIEVDIAFSEEDYALTERLLGAIDSNCAQVMVRYADLALERKEWASANEFASKAMVLSQGEHDPSSESRALSILGLAQSQEGEYFQAVRTVERAIRKARDGSEKPDLVRALTVMGRIMNVQRQTDQARFYVQEALSVAIESGLKRRYGSVLRQLSWIHLYSGNLLEALEDGQQALSIWRDLGLTRRELDILNDLAEINDQLGRSYESKRLLEKAHKLIGQMGDPYLAAINQYHRAYNHLFLSDESAPEAVELAQEALLYFRAQGQKGWEAAALYLQGNAYWVAGIFDQAINVLQKSLEMHEQLGELLFVTEIRSHLAMAYLGAGELPTALQYSHKALLALSQGEVLSDDIGVEIYYVHAAVLSAAGNQEGAEYYFRRAYLKLLSIAAELIDEHARQVQFNRSPLLRHLMVEVYERGIASEPSSGVVQHVVSGLDNRPIEVTWTVDTGPPDLALRKAQGVIALRRTRLSRLIREAESQGAKPNCAQLAAALGVSSRTVQRDLVILRGN